MARARRRNGRAGWLFAGALLGLVAGCSSNEGVRSNTPRITAGTTTTLSGRLLSLADAQRILGEAGLHVEDLADVPVFENPDPRGPCGGRVPRPPVGPDTAGRAFTRSDLVVIELIQSATSESADYVQAISTDALESRCGPFTSTTNEGLSQAVSQVRFIELEGAAATGIAWTSRVDVGAVTAYAGVGAVQVEEQLVFIQMQSAAPIDGTLLASLVEQAATDTAT